MHTDKLSEEKGEKTPASYKPTQEEIDAYTATWVYKVYSGESEKKSRLILSKDHYAQLVFQDGIGHLLGLSSGTWSIVDKERLKIDLTADIADGKQIEEQEKKPLGGEYGAHFGDFGSLTLSCESGATPLVRTQELEPATFYNEACLWGNGSDTTGGELCGAVLRWYEDINGEAYPGVAVVSSAGPEGWTIHLYEDIGDHIATYGWYLIDPDTLIGTDEILNKEINFSPYSEGI